MSYLSPGVNVLIDGQWGSTGKGKLGAFLSLQEDLSFGTADFQSNAGHTVILHGEKFVVNHVPSCFPNRDVSLYLAPASTITVSTFLKELELLQQFKVADRITIHPHVAVITDEDVAEEQQNMRFNASTMKGVGAALARKVKRKAILAKDVPELEPYVFDLTRTIIKSVKRGCAVLAETSQGFDLSLNHGHSYPFVTSRDVTTSSVLANLGVAPNMVGEVWGCLRTYPIRVGHLLGPDGSVLGHSGPCYGDQIELSWEEISISCGASVTEKTTVTNRTRRVFTFSKTQFKKFLFMCQPTKLFVNFVNYLDHGVYGKDQWSDMSEEVINFVDDIHEWIADCDDPTRCGVSLLGTGPDNDHMVKL
jgi:adenylosuccinate synthase